MGDDGVVADLDDFLLLDDLDVPFHAYSPVVPDAILDDDDGGGGGGRGGAGDADGDDDLGIWFPLQPTAAMPPPPPPPPPAQLMHAAAALQYKLEAQPLPSAAAAPVAVRPQLSGPSRSPLRRPASSAALPVEPYRLSSPVITTREIAPPVDEEERRLRKLEKNRLAAKNCRLRKKQMLQSHKGVAETLSQRFCSTRQQHFEMAEERLRLQEARLLLPLTPSHRGLSEVLRRITEAFGPDCEDLHVVHDFHIRELERRVMSPQVKLLLWIACRAVGAAATSTPSAGASLHGDGLAGSGAALWERLSAETGLTTEQLRRLSKELGDVMGVESNQQEMGRMREVMASLQHFREAVARHSRALQAQEREMMSVLAPEQALRLRQWISSNQRRHDDAE